MAGPRPADRAAAHRRASRRLDQGRTLKRRALLGGAAAAAAIAAIASCRPIGLLNSFDRLGRGKVRRAGEGIAYGPGPRQTLDVWVPADAARGKSFPVVIFFYGGGWVAGSRTDYAFVGAALAAQGFVTVIPDYRLVPEVRFPTFIEDCALAVKWVRDHVGDYGGDPGRLALSGHSAGAYNAAMLALDRHYLTDAGVNPAIVRAAALLSGPYDFYPFTEAFGRGAMGLWPHPEETQPIHYARADAPPMLLMHGTADTTARPRNSERLAARLQALGAPVELKLYPGASHVDLIVSLSRPLRRRSPALADMTRFLLQHLA